MCWRYWLRGFLTVRNLIWYSWQPRLITPPNTSLAHTDLSNMMFKYHLEANAPQESFCGWGKCAIHASIVMHKFRITPFEFLYCLCFLTANPQNSSTIHITLFSVQNMMCSNMTDLCIDVHSDHLVQVRALMSALQVSSRFTSRRARWEAEANQVFR